MPTLAAQIVLDATDVFLNVDEFAEAFSHTPASVGASTTAYCGVIEIGEALVPQQFSDGVHYTQVATIYTATNGTATTGGPTSVAEGDTITIGGVDYKVYSRPEKAAGMQTIVVHRIVRRETGNNDYRIPRF